jgi:hypothetical protein
MTFAKSIPESAPAAILQQRAAQYAEMARFWMQQEAAAHWYALARQAA